MLSVPPLVQRQVSDALAHISRFDFPALWPTLLPELVAELAGAKDYASMIGLLETVCAVFERFRGAYDSDENRAPLKYAVDTFAQPLMARYRLVQARAEAAAREGAPPAEQALLADARRLMCTAFYLLNWLDLPEVFEDNLAEWVGWFHAALTEQNAATTSSAGRRRSFGPKPTAAYSIALRPSTIEPPGLLMYRVMGFFASSSCSARNCCTATLATMLSIAVPR
jgi:exportin-2 (importin alpha re-exporter)